MVRKSEQETAAVIARLRGKWAGTRYASTFEATFNRVVRNPATRDQVLAEAEQGQGSGGFWTLPAIPREVLYVAGIIVAFLVFGYILQAIGWKPKEKSSMFDVPKPADTYGSADFAEPRPSIPDPMYVFNGVFFGKSSMPSPAHLAPFAQHQGAPICSEPERHTLVVAQTRTGKGTRVILPTLLRYGTGSALVIDPKGENAVVTARARVALGQTVHIINPWGVKQDLFQKLGYSTATYNPLDILDRNDDNVVANAEALALAICPLEKGSREAFWTNSAAGLLTAVLLWVTDQPGEEKTLARAYSIVAGRSRADFKKDFLAKMAASDAFGGAIRELSASFIDLAQETYSGVLSNLTTAMKFLGDLQVKRNTATSSFSMDELVSKATTVYLIIPPDRVKAQRTWLRLLIAAGMQKFKTRTSPVTSRCMFLIDELPALGRLDDLPDDISTMAGYGVDFTLIVQGLDQLKERYGGDAATIINNCAYKWFCNVGDLDSAKYLSQMLGKKTVPTTSTSTSTGHNPGGDTTGSSTSHGETGRDLLMPDEILKLGRDTAILLAPGDKPHYLRPVDYWDLPEAFGYLKEYYPHMYWGKVPLQYDPNPYHASKKTPA